MTTHEVSKKIQLLNDERTQLLEELKENSIYTYALSEKDNPIIPNFNLSNMVERLNKVEGQITYYKHLINHANSTNTIEGVTIDTILIRLGLLSKKKDLLVIAKKSGKSLA